MKEIQFRIIDPTSVIVKKILGAIVSDFNKAVKKSIKNIDKRIKEETRRLFQHTKTYQALLRDGELSYHLGIPKSQANSRIATIIDSVINGIQIEYNPVKLVGNDFIGSTKIGILKSDLSEIFSLSSDIIEVKNYSKKYPDGLLLPVMEWLLRKGDSFAIADYTIQLESNLPGSRSGGALMIANTASIWRMPPQYGPFSSNDNFLTRALTETKDYENVMMNIIKQEIERAM